MISFSFSTRHTIVSAFLSETTLSTSAFSLFTQYRTGIHMGGNLSQDPYLSFDTVGFREQSKAELPGIAVVPEMATTDQALKLVVPYAPRVKK